MPSATTRSNRCHRCSVVGMRGSTRPQFMPNLMPHQVHGGPSMVLTVPSATRET